MQYKCRNNIRYQPREELWNETQGSLHQLLEDSSEIP